MLHDLLLLLCLGSSWADGTSAPISDLLSLCERREEGERQGGRESSETGGKRNATQNKVVEGRFFIREMRNKGKEN